DGSHYEKRGKGEPICIDDEIPYDIPDGWEWCRFGTLCKKLVDGSHNPPPKQSKGYPVISAMNIKDGRIDLSLVQRFADKKGFEKENPRTRIARGDIILGIIGGSIGNAAIYNHDVEVIAQRSIAIINTFGLNSYSYWTLQSPLFFSYYSNASGTAQGGVYLGSISNMLTPVPPVQEQVRIIARIQDLLSLVDDYGSLESVRERLDAELPDRLRKSILQLAVQGKLVKQNPTDEPASVLLERIRAERATLVKAKKIRAPKGGESVIYRASDGGYYEKRGKGKPQPIEVPFEIPNTWEWARLSSVVSIAGGGTPDKGTPSYWHGGIPWASVKDLKSDTLTSTIDTISADGLASKPSISRCSIGDLIVATRLVPGKSTICAIDCTINQDLKRIRTSLNVEYLHIWFQSERPAFHRLGQGTTVPGIKLKDLEEALIPIPPFAEQPRISQAFNDAATQITNQ
ncbi:MAG: restriction endonuclease subunit S, partial [Atopobiaceae bacterium]|nr:restriction endonuclease subunit S [Atopobiaceae bacterium]